MQLFSCHFNLVKVAVLLHQAGKDGMYIKLRIRWLSNCYEVYLRNTQTICAQHTTALHDVNRTIFVLIANYIPQHPVHANGVTETEVDLDDED